MKLKTLTPVHIGDGEEIIPWEYAVENKHIKIYTPEKIVSQLREKFYGDKLRNLLLELRNEVRDYGFSKSLGEFLRERNINIEEIYRVETRVPLKNRTDYKGIKSFIKSRKDVYIPGSEVKGALRTIFIFGVVYEELKRKNAYLYNSLKKIIENALEESYQNPRKRRDAWKEADKKISALIFRDNKDAKYDIFKAVHVSDSESKDPSECLYVDAVKLIGSSRQFFELHELLKEGTEFSISIRIDENVKRALKKVSENPYVDYLTLENLKKFSREFYRFLYDVESSFFSRKGLEVNGLEKVKEALGNGDFILRIGKHQGFLSLTIMLMFYINKKLENFYRKVYRAVVQSTGREVNKTRKLTSENKPLGWVILK
ncbi:MAG TPA: type III-A CRISPR-associated RAMP protein Csm5 [Aquifex aeolicus]|nr:type III-A CRISPR-associated RAMP protein Csm5 [Aquifex aeolicus]